jgi:phospholipid/cholesterol/gamma-HCH transport system ATP-binding protein
MIRVEGVSLRFGRTEVLTEVSFEVRRGETTCILGTSGGGKSTLMKLMIGALRPTSGRIFFDGEEISGMTERELNRVRSKFGVMFQGAALLNSMTVGRNVALPIAQHSRLPPEAVETIVKVKLEQVGLRDAEDLLPAEISGGMKKRAGIARAIALDPMVVFYDEPSAGLDPVSSTAIDDLMNGLRDKMGITSVVVTHELPSVERIADRVVFLHRGRVLAVGTLAELRALEDPVVTQFLSGSTEGPLTLRQSRSDFHQDLLNLEG